jgi:hypothetical protein
VNWGVVPLLVAVFGLFAAGSWGLGGWSIAIGALCYLITSVALGSVLSADTIERLLTMPARPGDRYGAAGTMAFFAKLANRWRSRRRHDEPPS